MNEIKTLSLKTSGLLKDNGTMDDEGLNDLLHHLSIKIENIISISNGTMRNGNIEKNGKDAFERHMREIDSHQIEKVGKEMRKMMWPDSTE